MNKKINELATDWILSNLSFFYDKQKFLIRKNVFFKPFCELLFVSLFKNYALKELFYKKFSNLKLKEKFIFDKFSKNDVYNLISLVFFNKDIIFTENWNNEIKFLTFRQQLEIEVYKSFYYGKNLYLDENLLKNSLIYQKLKKENFDLYDIYQLTHEVMYFSKFNNNVDDFLVKNKDYLFSTLNFILSDMIEKNNVDLICEIILCFQILDGKINTEYLEKARIIMVNYLNKYKNNSFLYGINLDKVYHPILVMSLLK